MRLGTERHPELILQTSQNALASLSPKLNSRAFVRIHRSIIVNLHYVKEVHSWFHGHHVVLLENGQEPRMSRYQKDVAFSA
jgi:two-component system, LytTR family, response regulator